MKYLSLVSFAAAAMVLPALHATVPHSQDGAPNLRMHYNFQSVRNSIVEDASGNGFNARVVAPASVVTDSKSDRMPTAMLDNSRSKMAGTGGSLRYEGKAPAEVSSFSISMWYRTSPGKAISGATRLLEIIGVADKTILLAAHDNSGSLTVNLGSDPLLTSHYGKFLVVKRDEWVFVTLVYDALSTKDNLRLYLGSQNDATRIVAYATVPQNLWSPSAENIRLIFGANATGARALEGYIADIRLYADSEPSRASALDIVQIEDIRREFPHSRAAEL